MARLKGQGEGEKKQNERNGHSERGSTKERREDGRVKGTYWRGGGEEERREG